MRWYPTLLVPLVLFGARAAHPDDTRPSTEPLAVTLRCPARVAPGRVRCDADATPAAGTTLAWADLVVLPGSIAPLRGRLAPADGEVRPERASFAFAVLAKDHGPAQVRVMVRAVVCSATGCAAASVEKRIDVAVE